MKYAIIDDNKCTFIDDDKQRLIDTLDFLPEKTEADIIDLNDDDVEQGYDGDWYLTGHAPEIPEEVALANAKSERAEAVSRITVEVDGLLFDGDETSQDRMARAITMANIAELTTTNWVLADNTIAEVTVQQLAQALVLAGQKQTELWVKPYAGADVGEVDE